jgi:hypothetical protein
MNQDGGLGVSRKLSIGAIPVWQGIAKDIRLVQGGFLLDQTGLVAGDVVPAGTPVVFNETTRTATYLPTAVIYEDAGAAAVAYKVKKGHTLKVGNYFASGAIGGKAYAITAIDTTNASYDTVTVGTTIGAVTAGDTAYASTATGATASALPAINGCLYREIEFTVTGAPCSVVQEGVAYRRRVPYTASIAAALLANGAQITYSNSY